jgi:hypothetical protein
MAKILTLAGIWFGAAAAASADFGDTLRHVRSSNANVRAQLRVGCEQSPTFRSLVETIEVTSVIVYVEPAVGLGGTRDGALLLAVRGSRDLPILRVLIRSDLAGSYAVGVIAHELQHVVEAATTGRLDSGAEMVDTFEKLDRGRTRKTMAFETDAARDVQQRVVAELRVKNACRK